MNPNDIIATNPSIIKCPVSIKLFGGLKLIVHNFIVNQDKRISSTMSVDAHMSKYTVLLQAYDFLRTTDFLKFIVAICCGKSFRTEDELSMILNYCADPNGTASHSRINIQINFDYGEDVFDGIDLDDIESGMDVYDVSNKVKSMRNFSGYCGKIPYTNICATRCTYSEYNRFSKELSITDLFEIYCMYEEKFYDLIMRMLYPLSSGLGDAIRNAGHMPAVSLFKVSVNSNMISITTLYTPAYIIDSDDRYLSAVVGKSRNFGMGVALLSRNDIELDADFVLNTYDNFSVPLMSNVIAQYSSFNVQMVGTKFHTRGIHHRNGFPYQARFVSGAFFTIHPIYHFSDEIHLESAETMPQISIDSEKCTYPVYECSMQNIRNQNDKFIYQVWTPKHEAKINTIIVRKIVSIRNIRGEDMLMYDPDEVVENIIKVSGLEFVHFCYLVWASPSKSELRFALCDTVIFDHADADDVVETLENPKPAKKTGFISAIREVFRKGKDRLK